MMTKFFPVAKKNNKKKDFSFVNTSTSRGMGRFGSNGGSASGTGPRLLKAQIPYAWLQEDMVGIVTTLDEAIVEREF